MILEKISKNVIIQIKNEINISDGNEIFFRGIPDKNGVVTKIEIIARGNKTSVPAILKRMKKREVIIHNHPSGYLFPSDADVSIASIYANQKDGASYIINNEANDIFVIVEINKNEMKDINIKPFFQKDGLLSKILKGFEYRKEQLQMAEHIEKGFNNNKKVIVEAGTGTGKTLAYLIPSIEWATKNKKKIVITTNTINLQEQLLYKDIPIVKKMLPQNFTYVLIKGRGNYICNRKATNIIIAGISEFNEITPAQQNQAAYILKWFKSTKLGDKGELPFEADYIIWEQFMSETDICVGAKCSMKEDCFFLKSREEKKRADLFITNHHMFFADLSIRKDVGFNTEFAILPDYDLVVFDEAHNIENIARDYFSYDVSKYSFNKIMNRIYHIGKSKSSIKYFELLAYLKKIKYSEYKFIQKEIDQVLIPLHIELLNIGNVYYTKVIELFSSHYKENINIRLRKDELEHWNMWQELKKEEKIMISKYNFYIKKIKILIRLIKDIEDETGVIHDFIKYTERLEAYFSNYNFITNMDDINFIYWMSLNKTKNRVKFVATPLQISGELDENLYSHLDYIVFTSATIAVKNNFNYFKKSIGLNEDVLEKIINSPFDYDKQMTVYIPNDLPAPTEKLFLNGVVDFVIQLINKTKGNTFILFTSYSTLNYLYYMVKDRLIKAEYELFLQGELPRTQLLDLYKKAFKPVLFGTSSFWEGVDIKGEKLSSVIIVKLPFKVPNDPIVEAIIENLNSQGKNAFMKYQIPESIIKFKQGIGRLIRCATDIGIVTILDNRIITKRYGKLFINSIPSKNIYINDKKNIINH